MSKVKKFVDILNCIKDNSFYSHVNEQNISIVECDGKFGVSFNGDFSYRFDNLKGEKFPWDFSTCKGANTSIYLSSSVTPCKFKTLEGLPDQLFSLEIHDLDELQSLYGVSEKLTNILCISRCGKLKSLEYISKSARKVILENLDIDYIDKFPSKPKFVTLAGLKIKSFMGIPNLNTQGGGSVLCVTSNLEPVDLSYIPECDLLEIKRTQVSNIENLKNFKGHVNIQDYYYYHGDKNWDFFYKMMKKEHICVEKNS